MDAQLARSIGPLMEIARESPSRGAFRREVLACLRPILGFDGATWSSATVDELRDPSMCTWQIPVESLDRARADHADEVLPMIQAAAQRGPLVDGGMSTAARRRSPLWSEVYRPIGIESWIGAALGGPRRVLTVVTISRLGRGTPFDDDDARAVHLLSPVLELGDEIAARRERMSATIALTKREREIVALVARGLTNEEIARILMISKNTVRNRLAAVFEKTGTANRAEIAARFQSG